MENSRDSGGLRVSTALVNLITIIVGMVAAYFLTIQSLKVELAAKAEGVVVDALDRKLANFEVMLKEGVVSKEEFYRFARDSEARLARIEFYLIDKLGDKVERP